MEEINLQSLTHGPHADLIDTMAQKCAADPRIQAIWVGGSLATGNGDHFSDIDFRLAVEPGTLDDWIDITWKNYLPLQRCDGIFMRFGEQALLHHLVLTDGTIVDFYVQDTTKDYFEPHVIVLLCRDDAFGEKLSAFARPAATLARDINGPATRRFLVDYWIITHKETKALARKYDLSPFVGLYWERLSLLRAWYMQATGQDINGRATLHMLGALHKGLDGQLTKAQQEIMGLPTRTPAETVTAIEAIRAEIAHIGRELAAKHQFEYPHELETTVLTTWDEHKAAITKR